MPLQFTSSSKHLPFFYCGSLMERRFWCSALDYESIKRNFHCIPLNSTVFPIAIYSAAGLNFLKVPIPKSTTHWLCCLSLFFDFSTKRDRNICLNDNVSKVSICTKETRKSYQGDFSRRFRIFVWKTSQSREFSFVPKLQ